MAFPSTPTNGQTATVNGITYSYSSSLSAWTRVQVNASAVSFSSNTITVNTSSFLIGTTLVTSTTTANQSLYTYSTSQYRSGKFMCQMTSGTSYGVTELLLIHDGTNCYMTQYGDVNSGTVLGVFDSSITSGNVSLLFTPTNASTTVKVSGNLIPI